MYKFQENIPLDPNMIAQEIYEALKDNYKVKDVVTSSIGCDAGVDVWSHDGKCFTMTITEVR